MTELSNATTCYAHPNRETSLRCKRCERYICTSCAVSTPTGYICKECMRERQKSFDTALWYDFALGFVVAGLLSGVASFLVTLIGAIGFIGFMLVFIGSSAAGGIIAEAVRAVTRRHRSRALFGVVVHDEGARDSAPVAAARPGLPAEDRERAFDRFWRGSQDGSGSGLGLAVVASLARAGGGSVALEESPLGGVRASARFRRTPPGTPSTPTGRGAHAS